MSEGPTILYIEDELEKPSEDDPFYWELTEAGYAVVVVLTKEEARQQLLTSRFACIILDIMLPIGEGDEEAEGSDWAYDAGLGLLDGICRGDFPLNSKTPVVVVSAITDIPDMSRILEQVGKERYVSKPFRPSELLDTVKRTLRATPKAEEP